MFGPDHSSLTQAAAGRVSMPFLPTLAVVAALGLASLYCPTSNPAAPEPARAVEAAAANPALSPTAFAPAAPAEAHPVRLPASLAFGAQYPIAAAPTLEASALTPVRPATRPAPRLAAIGRRPCQGRRCPETPHHPDPLAAVRSEPATAQATAAEDGPVPQRALPFTATVAETLGPAARVVGEAADLVRGGAASVTGSVALMAECLR